MDNLEKKVSDLINQLPVARNRQIVRSRFGLVGKNAKTLESIGQTYNITRERVRQIERDSLMKLRGSSDFKKFSLIFKKIDNLFDELGKVILEDRLVNFGPKSAITFLLALGDPYFSRPANAVYLAHWTSCPGSLKRADETIDYYIKFFQKQGRPVDKTELLKQSPGLSEKILLSYLEITKLINSNPFDQFGLTRWPEIKPRGVKDKAYLILEREQKPLHFTKITFLINQVDFRDGKEAQPQTVHNELIKDTRFKWMERGVYALGDK